MQSTYNFRDLKDRIGEELTVSAWHLITQDQIDQFAELTGDHQWIHVDTERTISYSPYGTTIAHGFFILSLISKFFFTSIKIEGISLGLNYGLNKVRFTHPVPVDSRIRAHISIIDFQELENGARVFYKVSIEIEGVEKPACVAETISQVYGKQ